MPEASIQWPEEEGFEINSAMICACHPQLLQAFGTMDGLKHPVQTSADEEMENVTYNGWLHQHFVSSVLVFNALGKFHSQLCTSNLIISQQALSLQLF